ncbi:MAG: hypothetical protein E7050_11530 [Lentisphaerae bacterium]|nr:hypothetical protein [Lentisphaerota bacterium]
MKKILLMSILLFCAGNLAAKHDGWYVNTLTRNYPTPHLTWAKNFPEAEVLLIFPRIEGRHVAELLQRYPVKETVFVTYNGQKIAHDGVYDAALSGTGTYEKNAEIREKIQKKYDAVVLVDVPFDKLSPDVQFQLLQQVKSGTGLLLINTAMPYSKPLANPAANPAFFTETIHPGTVLRAYQFEKGKICTVKYRKPGMMPDIFPDRYWAARYENAQMTLIRALDWVIKGNSVPLKAVKEGNVLHLPANMDTAEYRLRDEYNNILAQGKVENHSFTLPELPNGTYYFDLLLPGKSFSTTEFKQYIPERNITLNVASDTLSAGEPVKGTLITGKTFSKPAKIILSLIDYPHNRIWEKEIMEIPAGKNSISFEIKDYFMPNAAGYLQAALYSPESDRIGYTEKELIFPRPYPQEGYVQFSWGGPADPLMAMRSGDDLGFSAALSHYKVSLDNARQYTLLNQRLVSYLTRISVLKGKNGEVNFNKLFYPEGMKALAKLGGDHNFYRPEVQQIWKDYVHFRMKGLPRFSPLLYSLGDENGNTLSAGFGPSDLKSFRNYLKQKYGSIDKLNSQWGSSYLNFDVVPHRPLAVTEKENNAPEWNDHYEYMEKMFADVHHFCADEIRKLDPDAKVGLEGTFGNHNIELMMDKLDWWGPYSNLLEDELIRSLYPDRPRFIWIGYHKERTMTYPHTLLDALLKGVVNGNAWYALSDDFPHGILAIDYTDSYAKKYMDVFRRLRFGTAQQLIHTPLAQHGVGIFWNHNSKRASKADPRCSNPETSIAPLLRYSYRNGVNIEFVTARTLDRLKDMKILFLCGISSISDKESAAIIDFVKNGGTVIADLYPGVFNENLKKQNRNPLAELFGDILLKNQPANQVKPLQTPLMKASAALTNPAGPYMVQKNCGKGKAILMNFSFSVIETSALPVTPFDDFVSGILNSAGVKISHSATAKAALRIRKGKGYDLIGVIPEEYSQPVTITLPEKAYIYECGKGQTDKEMKKSFTVEPGNTPLRIFAAFAEKQPVPELILPETAQPGDKLEIPLASIPAGQFAVLRIFDPNGKELTSLSRVLKVHRASRMSFAFPFNAVCGQYRFLLQNFTTGLAVEKRVTLQ